MIPMRFQVRFFMALYPTRTIDQFMTDPCPASGMALDTRQPIGVVRPQCRDKLRVGVQGVMS